MSTNTPEHNKTSEQVKHTPGPWTVNHYTIKRIDGRVIAKCNIDHNDENEANARLIAAAPELLEDGNWMHAVLLQVEKHLTQDERDHLGEIAMNLTKAEGR